MNKILITLVGIMLGAQVASADPGRGSSGNGVPSVGGGIGKSSRSSGGSNGLHAEGGGTTGLVRIGSNGSNG